MAKAPAFQFYPGDWLRDAGLRSCSIGARGLWIDMICFMHGGTPYGYLKVGEKVIRLDNLASMVGESVDKVAGWLEELRQADVFSRDDDGAIYSRRMLRDENLRKTRAECGKMGGNPRLLDNQNPTTKDKQPSNQKPTPASSSSSASSSADVNTESASALSRARPSGVDDVITYGQEIGLPPAECERFHDHFTANGWKQGGRAAMKDWRAALRNWKRRAGEFGGGMGGASPGEAPIDWDAKAKRMADMAKEAKYQ